MSAAPTANNKLNGDAETMLYRHFDADGVLLYVGISLNAINRLSQHNECSALARNISYVKIEKFSSRVEALKAESRAIADENPVHNKQKKKSSRELDQELAMKAIDAAKMDVSRKIAYLDAVYDERSAATILNLSKQHVRQLIESGQLRGYVVFDGTINTRVGPRHIIHFHVTGWAIIDFLERVERMGRLPEADGRAQG